MAFRGAPYGRLLQDNRFVAPLATNERIIGYGRPMKMDRQMVVAVVLALEEWLETDHEARLQQHTNHAFTLKEAVQDIPGLTLSPMQFTMEEELIPNPINCLVMRFEVECKLNADFLETKMAEGNPKIFAKRMGQNIVFALDVITADEVTHVGKRINEINVERVEI